MTKTTTQTGIETRLARLTATADALNAMGWKGQTHNGRTQAALDTTIEKIERCHRILKFRYGVEA